MKSIFFAAALLIVFSGCSNNAAEKVTNSDTSATTPKQEEKKPDFGAILLGYTNDPVCEMPVKNSSIEDTTLFKGKIIGFCNKGCKDEFVKAPENYVAVLKKAK